MAEFPRAPDVTYTAAAGKAMITSSIIPCFNPLEFIRHCLRTLYPPTRPPWELTVVDNGSTDGTGMSTSSVQDASPAPVTVVGNAVNRAFLAAINQGLSVARAEYLVLLNNDAVVTGLWLDQLIALANVEGRSYKEAQEVKEEEHRRGGNHESDESDESAEDDWGDRDSLTSCSIAPAPRPLTSGRSIPGSDRPG